MTTWHKEGTVDVTSVDDNDPLAPSAHRVIGSGTSFVDKGVRVGQEFILDGPGERGYEITSVVSNNEIQIDPPYQGSTKTAQTYRVKPTLGDIRQARISLDDALDTIQGYIDGPLAGSFDGEFSVNVDGGERFSVDANGATINGLLTGTAVVSSQTDVTPGKVTTIGHAGFHGNSLSLVATDDLDVNLNYGIYSWNVNDVPAKAPPFNGSSMMSVLQESATLSVQEVFRLSPDANNMERWFRTTTSGSNSPWSKVFHQKNILGPVTESSGEVTGAIIERGVDGDAEYTLFADGTLIQQMEVTVDVTDTGAQGFTLPIPHVTGSGNDNETAMFSHVDTEPNVSIEYGNIRSVVCGNTDVFVRLKTSGTVGTGNEDKLRITTIGKAW